jgi:predicted esterase
VRHACVFLLLSSMGSCAHWDAGSTAPAPTAAGLAADNRTPAASPREAHEPFVELSVPGHDTAVVSLPRDISRRRPLLVAAHGAWDRPEPHCQLWRRITGARGFILCPRGQRTNAHTPREHAAYFYPHHFALAREVLAASEALASRYPQELDASAAVWAGFSQGAIHGALVIVLHPKLFPRAALVEGGNGFFNEWSPFAARKYAQGGGERVLFGCGSPYCVRTAERCAGYLEAKDVETLVAHAQGAGHSYGGAMEQQLSQHFDWLVAGDPRWNEE